MNIELINKRTLSGDKFFDIEINGRIVGTLQQPNRNWGGFYVASRDEREIREHFSSKAKALAFAATLA